MGVTMLLFRYNRYLAALDIFGVITVILIAFYLTWPEGTRLSQTQDGMVANILSEMAGIWLSVRLIDFFINGMNGTTGCASRVSALRVC
jgi:hypothetical protein